MYPCKSGKIPPIDSRDMVDTKLSRRRRRPGSALKLICPPSPLVGDIITESLPPKSVPIDLNNCCNCPCYVSVHGMYMTNVKVFKRSERAVHYECSLNICQIVILLKDVN